MPIKYKGEWTEEEDDWLKDSEGRKEEIRILDKLRNDYLQGKHKDFKPVRFQDLKPLKKEDQP